MIDYRVGDTRDLTGQLDDGSIDLVASSPPFLALRSYLPDGHESKHAEIGSEPDPATFLDTLLALTADWGRVLTPYGSIAIELGDTYAGSGGAGGDYNAGGMRDGQNGFSGSARQPGKNGRHSMTPGASGGHHLGGNGWPRPKSLALIPQLYACSLAYGRNILTGQPSPAGQWLVRNVIVWHRPNPAVGALGDKFRPSTSYIVVATRNPKRWFDLTAVRGEPSPNTHARTAVGVASRPTTGKTAVKDGNFHTLDTLHSTPGAPPLDCWFDDDGHDCWTVTTQPSRISHYAMWPPRLAERLILSMCPAQVCELCGEPRRRIEGAVTNDTARSVTSKGGDRVERAGRATTLQATGMHVASRNAPTLGWTECDCGPGMFNALESFAAGEPLDSRKYRPGRVLDPFAGTGTTLCVADIHGRDAIGFDIDARNRGLLAQRMTEVRRVLTGARPEIPGQIDMFDQVD